MALDAIGIVVEDIGRAREFYRHLELELPADATGHAEVTLAGGLRLMFDTVEIMLSFDPGWTAPTGSPRTTLAFGFTSPAEVDAKFEELVAAGGEPHKAPWDAFWGMRYAILRDADGNEIALFADLEPGGG